MPELIIQPVERARLPEALQILFHQLPADERRGTISRVERMFARGELDLDGLLVASSEGRLVGAMLTSVAAGAVGLVWPLRTVPGSDRREIEDRLLTVARQRFRSRGVKLAQALLMPEEEEHGDALERNGFTHITRLWFLRHHLDLSAMELAARDRLSFEAYAPHNHARFHATLRRTYEKTRDCPELDGVRTMDEVLAGHQAQGKFDPRWWWLVRDGTDAVGVLLVNPHADGVTCEIVYLGIVPEARGRGFGRELTRKALREAKLNQMQALTLSVDARNQPAQRIYHQLGFEAWDRREVYLDILR